MLKVECNSCKEMLTATDDKVSCSCGAIVLDGIKDGGYRVIWPEGKTYTESITLYNADGTLYDMNKMVQPSEEAS